MNLQQAITAYEMQSKGYMFTTSENNELGTRAMVTFGQCDITDYDPLDQLQFEPFILNEQGNVIMVYDNDDEDINHSPDSVDVKELQCWAPVEMNW